MLNFNTVDKDKFGSLIKEAKFKELFNELGWDHAKINLKVSFEKIEYSLSALAEKKGFAILECNGPDGLIPERAVRCKIDRSISKKFHEHLIIYNEPATGKQIWQLAVKEPNKPIVIKETPYYKNQQPELLLQKLGGLLFNLDEEDSISLVDVKQRVTEAFNKNSETVTKKFYVEFKKQHNLFIKFIKGITSTVDAEWYASLMLNRLMFIYFIQKKGFLNNDVDYLSNKLAECSRKKGKNKFYKSFYRSFLLVLFHKGLGAPERPEELTAEIGRVPYLNGGLFDVHELENKYSSIQIDDAAFENIFSFFDSYNWHLDTRITASGKDINPDVIGYIFEKYINDRAAMGAYYTKEDITEYISKNTIIPFLFDKVKKNCANAFKEDSSIWKMFKEDPDSYIYESVRKGTELELPEDIKTGVDTSKPNLLERRKNWNLPADEKYALPTEIWREVVERRNRYFEVKSKIENDEIRGINDFITFNLNIRQFAQDCIEQYEGSDFINSFYKAIKEIKILDPTCGSGAFLFAALNILEPLYEACIDRMESFIEEDNKCGGKKFPQFRAVINEINVHPSKKYYIYKSIILNNLYGVDIMKEAVETAKLRLFLKLVAEAAPDSRHSNMGLEPLPDIDFNIKSGNTLVGFASLEEIKKVYEEKISAALQLYGEEKIYKDIIDRCEKISRLYNAFKDKQNTLILDQGAIKNGKADLRSELAGLNDILNTFKAKEYNVDTEKKKTYAQWLESHKPFHWFSEFYEIMNAGGFDVIIGNPPYVEYSAVKENYKIIGYATESCGNLYANVMERCIKLMNEKNCCGYIVQLPLICTDRMIPLQKLIIKEYFQKYFASFDDRPAKLFDGLQHIRAVIFIGANIETIHKEIMSTRYTRWYTQNRNTLFDQINYNKITSNIIEGSVPKISNALCSSVFDKILNYDSNLEYMNGKLPIYFHNAPQYFIRATDFIPFFSSRNNTKVSTQIKTIYVADNKKLNMILALLNSTIFYLWFIWHSDCRHLNIREVNSYPIVKITEPDIDVIEKLNKELMASYKKNKKRKVTSYASSGEVVYDEFYPKKSKDIIDEIDKLLAKHYGFTEEELDFIINYDIKYRMGKELENGE